MKRPTWIFVLATTLPLSVRAQQPATPVPGMGWKHQVAHYGKWVAVVSAVAFTASALQQHHYSDQAWNTLLNICETDSQNCALGGDGRYVNYTPELNYQLALYYDHRARWRLITGQVSLLAAIGLFVADRRSTPGTRNNIPYHPVEVTIAPTSDGVRAGLRVAF